MVWTTDQYTHITYNKSPVLLLSNVKIDKNSGTKNEVNKHTHPNRFLTPTPDDGDVAGTQESERDGGVHMRAADVPERLDECEHQQAHGQAHLEQGHHLVVGELEPGAHVITQQDERHQKLAQNITPEQRVLHLFFGRRKLHFYTFFVLMISL